MRKNILVWGAIIVACAIVAVLVTSTARGIWEKKTPTWTYIVNDTGAVLYETESKGYPQVTDDFAQTFYAINPDGSFSKVQTDFSVLTFPFRVQVFQSVSDGHTYFARSYSGDANYSAPEPTPTSSTSP